MLEAHVSYVEELARNMLKVIKWVGRFKLPLASVKGVTEEQLDRILDEIVKHRGLEKALADLELIKSEAFEIERRILRGEVRASNMLSMLESVLRILRAVVSDIITLNVILSDVILTVHYISYCNYFELVSSLLHEALNLLFTLYGVASNTVIIPLISSSDSLGVIQLTQPSTSFSRTIFSLHYPLMFCNQSSRVYSNLALLLHEMGHVHLRLNLRVSSHVESVAKTIIDRLRDLEKNEAMVWRRWLREIYSDVFALSIVGTAYVRALLEHYYCYSTARPLEQPTHPPLVLRTYISYAIAKWMVEQSLLDAKELQGLEIVPKLARAYTGKPQMYNYNMKTIDELLPDTCRLLEPLLEHNAEVKTTPYQLLRQGILRDYKVLRMIISHS